MTEPRVYTLELPAGLELLTLNQRMHWRPRNARIQALRQAAFIVARNNKVPTLDRAEITCRIHFPTRRRRDIHNWMPTAKACVDGLVDAGVLTDDNDDHLDGPVMQPGIPQPQAVVVLEIREVLPALTTARSTP